jgi:hypothetical protein
MNDSIQIYHCKVKNLSRTGRDSWEKKWRIFFGGAIFLADTVFLQCNRSFILKVFGLLMDDLEE